MHPTIEEMEKYLYQHADYRIREIDIIRHLFQKVLHLQHQCDNLAQQMYNLRTQKPIVPIVETEANHQQLPPITDIT